MKLDGANRRVLTILDSHCSMGQCEMPQKNVLLSSSVPKRYSNVKLHQCFYLGYCKGDDLEDFVPRRSCGRYKMVLISMWKEDRRTVFHLLSIFFFIKEILCLNFWPLWPLKYFCCSNCSGKREGEPTEKTPWLWRACQIPIWHPHTCTHIFRRDPIIRKRQLVPLPLLWKMWSQ